jgi:hypothetical protein
MAIIFPSHIKNVTGGELKEIQKFGVSQSGLISSDKLDNYIRSKRFIGDITQKNEPWGKFMSTLEQSRQELQQSTEAIRVASHALVEACNKANNDMVESGRKMRDNTEKVGVAMQKFSNIATSANLSKIADDAARLAESLERLVVLEESGQLRKLIAAMSLKG